VPLVTLCCRLHRVTGERGGGGGGGVGGVGGGGGGVGFVCVSIALSASCALRENKWVSFHLHNNFLL